MASQFKWIKQQDTTDCAVACISMVLEHYGSKMPAHKLRNMTGTNRRGTSALGMKNTFEKLKFNCNAVEADNNVWYHEDMIYPAIAYVVIKQRYQHYVVIYETDQSKLMIADPAEGLYTMTYEEFNNIWSGVLLLPQPTDQYKPVIEQVGGLTFFIPSLFRSKKLVFSTIIASFLATSLSIVSSYYFQGVIDNILPEHNLSLLNITSLGLIGVYVFKVIFEFIRRQLITILGQQLSKHIMLDYFNHVLKLPIKFFDTRKNGDIISRFLDANKIIDALASASLILFLDVAMVIIVGTFLFIQNNILFYITLVSLPVYFITAYIFVQKYDSANEKEMAAGSTLNSGIIESLNGIETIKAYNGEKKIYENTCNNFLDFMEYSMKKVKLDNIQHIIKQGIQLLISAGVLWAGAYYIINGSMSIGQLITYNALLVFFTNPLESIINLQTQLQTAQVASKRLNEVLSITSEESTSQDNNNHMTFDHQINIQNLTFSYDLKEPILNNINCRIRANQTVAIVGNSGSGKSTLAKLMIKFYEPATGMIYYDNTPITDIKHSVVRENITYVPQDSFFFKGTILENLLFGLSELPQEESIFHACEQAKIRKYIDQLPLGLKTPLEEGASNLSSGQKQRLAIARALLRDTNIIIFDEATSNIDIFAENNIINSISQLSNKTIIHITHNLSIAKKCDSIFLIHEGTIKEKGTHEELVANNHIYNKLWNTISE